MLVKLLSKQKSNKKIITTRKSTLKPLNQEIKYFYYKDLSPENSEINILALTKYWKF